MRDQAKGLAVDRTTAFRFASVSKVFAATLAAKLVEEGKLNPDLPISRYRKDLPEHFQEITIRQLLSHTSGMPHYQARDENRGDKHYSSITDALEVIGSRPLLAAPGESYVYSSHAYTLLSAVLESVAKDEYLRLVERHLTRPIGIRSIGAEDITKPKATRSNIYELTADGAVEITPRGDYSYSWAGAGFEGNASDLALFGSNLAAGNILKPETISYIQELSRTNSGETVGTNNYRMGFAGVSALITPAGNMSTIPVLLKVGGPPSSSILKKASRLLCWRTAAGLPASPEPLPFSLCPSLTVASLLRTLLRNRALKTERSPISLSRLASVSIVAAKRACSKPLAPFLII